MSRSSEDGCETEKTLRREPHRMHHGTLCPEITRWLPAVKKRFAAAKTLPSKLDETVSIAVWNIRVLTAIENGSVKR